MNSRPLESKRVLVVEDQYYLASDITSWLEDAGAKVVGPAPDEKHACELLDRETVDSAVVDINLGRGPTYEVAKELTQRHVPFLFATGYDAAAIPVEFEQAARLEKPFRARQLIAAVRDLGTPA
jgi:DNA-binding response OmpR family regulator